MMELFGANDGMMEVEVEAVTHCQCNGTFALERKVPRRIFSSAGMVWSKCMKIGCGETDQKGRKGVETMLE
jgi:hypothetical protein